MKQLLLIDAFEAPQNGNSEALAHLDRWFGRYLDPLPGLAVQTIGASSPELETLAARADALMVSGSPLDAWSDDPIVLRLTSLLHIAVTSEQPVFGVCFGHQILARAMGGKVQHNPVGWEVGETEITLTPAGHASPLFAGLPATFRAIAGHQDAVLSLPPDAVLLATNFHTPIQAFAVGDYAFGVQFHPEMNGQILRTLWKDRRERLRGEVRFDLDAALDGAGETPEAGRIFQNFTSLLHA
jgi:GMP synthase (glutamine-hydrolysing)